MAGTEPKLTALAPVNPVPVTVTVPAPPSGPAIGLTPLTVGAASAVNRSTALVGLVPLKVVTVTSTVPAAALGETEVICMDELTV